MEMINDSHCSIWLVGKIIKQVNLFFSDMLKFINIVKYFYANIHYTLKMLCLLYCKTKLNYHLQMPELVQNHKLFPLLLNLCFIFAYAPLRQITGKILLSVLVTNYIEFSGIICISTAESGQYLEKNKACTV